MDVSVEEMSDGTLAVKLASATCEVNVYATRGDVLRLRGVGTASWEERRSLQIGMSAGSPVFWSRAPGSADGAFLMIGQDDESWDIGLTVPQAALDEIIKQAT